MVNTKIASLALVTGASSGIGKCFAAQLAAGGTDLILVARNQKRLDELAARLRDRGDVDLLVNNAGFGHTGRFADLELEKSQAQIDCNVSALVRLAHASLQGMRKARRGGIINIASGAAFLPSPTLAVYAATKAFVVSFTQALHEEVKGDNVRVTVVCPGFTRTEFQTRAEYDTSALPSFVWQTPEAVVAESLAALAAGKVIVNTGIQNKVMAGMIGFVPRSMIAGLVGRMTG